MATKIVSYGVTILAQDRLIHATVNMYRDAVKYLLTPVLDHYDEIKDFGAKEKMNHIERYVHKTSEHDAQYGFDGKFVKFPSYLRRSAITDAIGIVDSYKKLVVQWEESGCKKRKPLLSVNHDNMPCLFRGNMFRTLESSDGQIYAQLKLYSRQHKDWIWHTVRLKKSDMNYITSRFDFDKASAPVLEKKHHRYGLRFSFKVETPKLPKTVNRVCSVDLGLNTDATCTALNKDGTVTARYFYNDAKNKDFLNRVRIQIREAQSRGNKKPKGLWTLQNNRNHEMALQVANHIVDFAIANDCDCIVFEHLGKFRGKSSQKIQLWRKNDVQRITERLAHRYGIRISRINPKGTSKYAYDGSGEVVRDENNYSICTFTTGKKYNCDLSASYNIGARYFIREALNSLSEINKASVEAKVPLLKQRTKNTLDTLISMNAVLNDMSLSY